MYNSEITKDVSSSCSKDIYRLVKNWLVSLFKDTQKGHCKTRENAEEDNQDDEKTGAHSSQGESETS